MTLYNLDTTVSLEKLYQSFVTFGDVKDVHGMPGHADARIIEFYDGEETFSDNIPPLKAREDSVLFV